jgi:hypothetical protein
MLSEVELALTSEVDVFSALERQSTDLRGLHAIPLLQLLICILMSTSRRLLQASSKSEAYY